MTREDITTRQAGKIYEALHPTLGFLTRLEERLGELGLPDDDEYMGKLKAARDAYRALAAETLKLTRWEREVRPDAR